MKKRMMAILLALAMVFSLAACGQKEEAPAPEAGGEPQQSAEPVVLRLSEQNSETSSNATYWKKVAELVEEYSGGSLILECYWSNSLCSYDIESLAA